MWVNYPKEEGSWTHPISSVRLHAVKVGVGQVQATATGFFPTHDSEGGFDLERRRPFSPHALAAAASREDLAVLTGAELLSEARAR